MAKSVIGLEGVAGKGAVEPGGVSEASSADRTGAAGFRSDAATLYRAGQYLRAAEAALDLDEEQGEQAQALALAARSYANMGDLQRARACCERAIACDRLSASNHYLLSIILEQQGDKAAAAKSLRNALFIDDDYLLAYLALANLNLSSGDHKEAGRNFSTALRLLETRPADEVLPEAEGMSAGALAQAIRGLAARG